MEEEIKKTICELRDFMGKGEIIAIVYNPTNESGMQIKDCSFLNALFDKNKYTYPLILLSGMGGDFSTGTLFPSLINRKVKNYRVFVPRVCGSALCYTILKSKQLFIGENTHISQIDPTFEHDGEWVRAVKLLHSPNDELRKKSRVIFDLAQDYIKKLSKRPSVFKYKYMREDEFQHVELIAACFMGKEAHCDGLNEKDLVDLEVNFEKVHETEADKLGNELVALCQDYAIKSDVRVLFASSVPISLGGVGEGTFIAPLD